MGGGKGRRDSGQGSERRLRAFLPTTEVGKDGEARAAAYLVARGYAIVARNWRCKLGELDLVARDGDTLAFVEVRSRADGLHGSALATVGAGKQRQVVQVAAAWLAAHSLITARACRFDVVGITGDEILLIKDAFRVP